MTNKISLNAQRFFEAMSIVSDTVINKDAIQNVINVLVKWRDPKGLESTDLRWAYDFQYFIDEDGRQFGDTLSVFLRKIVGVQDLSKYAMERGEKEMILEFARYTGMPYDHVVALGMLGGFPSWEDAPSLDMISPRDVARTLHNYLFDEGNSYPNWSWYVRAAMDDDAPTLDEFVAKCKAS